MIHLHVASQHSVHYGTARPHVLVEAAAEWGAAAAALTDRDTLAGAVRHVRACLASGIGPIIGAELLVDEGETPPSTVTVLAHGRNDGAGWASVARLVSSAHMRRRRHQVIKRGANTRRPSVTRSTIRSLLINEEREETATILLGPGSDVGQALLRGENALAQQLLDRWRAVHGCLVIEVVCHFSEPDQTASLPHAARLLEFAYANQVPAIISNAVRYAEPGEAASGDLLDAVGLLEQLGDFPAQPNDQAWLKPANKMRSVLRVVVEHSSLSAGVLHEVLDATNRVAERCILDPQEDIGWRKPKVPELNLLGLSPDADPLSVLTHRCKTAIAHRYPYATYPHLESIHQRLDQELGVIHGFGFETYFLTVADVMDVIKRMGVRAQGRGSGAGSIVNHLLGVSPVDPLEHGLLFERFLGMARSTLPDIDIDVESARRHDIYREVFERYGEHRVTLLSMSNRYRGRGAIRDAGLALGVADEHIEIVAEHVWRLNAKDLTHQLQHRPELAPVAQLAAQDPHIVQLIEMAERLDRIPRHLSMHPCGVILSDANLLSLTPVQPSGVAGIAMSQFDKDDIDDLGLIKLDILGVRMQSAIAHTLDQIQVMHGSGAAHAGGLAMDARYVSSAGTIDLEAIPTDDEETYEAIRSTHTLGMFQIESPGQRELIGRLQPDRYDDLIADIALFRPGPMKGNMVQPFLDAKHHPAKRKYLHPLLAEATEDAYGTVIFHEHVMHIFSICMGIDLAAADELRRRLGGKEDAEIEAQFRAAARERREGVASSGSSGSNGSNGSNHGKRLLSDNDIDRIWSVVQGFGGFGFCKAHGAAFAITTWQSAWLKTHYPAHFMAGLLEHDPGMYPRRLLVAEARRLNVPILPVDVTNSGQEVVVERVRATPPGARIRTGDLGVRMSLVGIRGMSEAETVRIISTRPHRDIRDLYTRAQLSRPTLQRLAAVGALDSLAPSLSRGKIIAFVRELTAVPRQPAGVIGQGLLDMTAAESPRGRATEPSDVDQVATDLATLGFEQQGHALDAYREVLERLQVTPASLLAKLPDRTQVLVAGVRVATQTPPMRSGQRVVFISLDDGTGVSDTAFFPDAQEVVGPAIFTARLLVIAGVTRRSGERGISITASNAWPLPELARTVGASASRPA